MSTIAERVREARLQRGWSQQQLADAAGVSQTTIDKIESGQTARSKFLPEVFSALEIDPFLLMGTEKYRDSYSVSMLKSLEETKDLTPLRESPSLLMPVFIANPHSDKYFFTLGNHPYKTILRPRQLDPDQSAYGVYITNNSMHPELEAGDIALFHTQLPVFIGMTGIYFQSDRNNSPQIIGRLVDKTAEFSVAKLWEGNCKLRLPAGTFSGSHRLFGKLVRDA